MGMHALDPPLASPFGLRTTTSGTRATVTVTGEVDLATAGRLEREMAKAIAAGARTLVLDLSQVGFMSSSGLHVLIARRQHAARSGRPPAHRVRARSRPEAALPDRTGRALLLRGTAAAVGRQVDARRRIPPLVRPRDRRYRWWTGEDDGIRIAVASHHLLRTACV